MAAEDKSVLPKLSEATLNEVIPIDPGKGERVSGKNWKVEKKAFRIKSLGVKSASWKRREEQRLKQEQDKARLKALREEKENEQKEKVRKIKERREKKAEEERYERLAQVMHAKKLDRLKRREKRNKLLKER